MWFIYPIFGIIGGTVCYFYEKFTLAVATAIAGSFLAVISILLYAKPEQPYKRQDGSIFVPTLYLIMGGVWIGLSIAGLGVQLFFMDWENDKDNSKDELKTYDSYKAF